VRDVTLDAGVVDGQLTLQDDDVPDPVEGFVCPSCYSNFTTPELLQVCFSGISYYSLMEFINENLVTYFQTSSSSFYCPLLNFLHSVYSVFWENHILKWKNGNQDFFLQMFNLRFRNTFQAFCTELDF